MKKRAYLEDDGVDVILNSGGRIHVHDPPPLHRRGSSQHRCGVFAFLLTRMQRIYPPFTARESVADEARGKDPTGASSMLAHTGEKRSQESLRQHRRVDRLLSVVSTAELGEGLRELRSYQGTVHVTTTTTTRPRRRIRNSNKDVFDAFLEAAAVEHLHFRMREGAGVGECAMPMAEQDREERTMPVMQGTAFPRRFPHQDARAGPGALLRCRCR